MSISNKHSADEFDRSVCFTFFPSWVNALRKLSDTDPQAALDAFFILSDYCLYDTEPDPKSNPWGFAWPVIKDEAIRSINNRRRGFGREDVAMSDAIRAYHAENPDATQREIADFVGCSTGKVNKVLKAAPHGAPGDVSGSVHVHVHDNNNGNGEYNSPLFHSVNKNEEEIFGTIPDEKQKLSDYTAAEQSAAFTILGGQ